MMAGRDEHGALHLVLNHIPRSRPRAVGLLLAARARKSDELTLAGFTTCFIVGLLTIPAYLSGNVANDALSGADLAAVVVTRHQEGALLAFGAMMVTSAVAWVGLWLGRRDERGGTAVASAVLVLAVGSAGLMANAATMGGAIRHRNSVRCLGCPELCAGAGWVWPPPSWEQLGWPALRRCIRRAGAARGVLLPCNLRMLGVMRNVPFRRCTPCCRGQLAASR